MKSNQYFYFAPNDNRLGYGDNREIKVGETHTVERKPVLCKSGLHASKRLINALAYAPGSKLYLVELGGDVVHGDDKSCATERRYITRFNAEKLLREFARKQALINIEKIKPYCTDSDYSIILRWLEHGSPKDRRAAESAACAAESAAWSAPHAARSAAWSAALSASDSDAERAAWSASESAAWSVVESTARSAARSAANKMLTDMVKDATGWDI